MASPEKKTLKLCSYNSQGLGVGRVEYMSDLLNECDILLIQEHWLLTEQISTFMNRFRNVTAHVVSGMESNVLLSGRPFGGCAILVSTKLDAKVEPLVMQSKRVCAVSIVFRGIMLLLFCVYMPCDTESDQENVEEFEGILAEILSMCELYPTEYIVIGGDLNTSFNRAKSLHTRSLNAFLDVNTFRCGSNHPLSSVSHTFESKVDGSRSTLDHLILTEVLYSGLLKYYDIDTGTNMSDHSALFAEFDIFVNSCDSNDMSQENSRSCLSWSTASENDITLYRAKLEYTLMSSAAPLDALNCSDVGCNVHKVAIESYYNEVCHACIDSSRHIRKKRGRVATAGWSDHVQRFKESSLLWHNIWKECGRPNVGLIYEIRKSARKKYHSALKKVRADQNNLQSTKMADAVLLGDHRDLWTEVRKIRSNNRSNVNVIDGKRNGDICTLFADKYRVLYNSVNSDPMEIVALKTDIDEMVNRKCTGGDCYCSHSVTSIVVKNAIQKLKPGKHDGNQNFFTDHLKRAPPILHDVLAVLFSAMISHSIVPEDFLLSTLSPIPKSYSKPLSSSDNYRAIAMSSIICKLLDHVIIAMHSNVLLSSELQFGFKSGHSTLACNCVLQEIVHHYTSNGSKVFCLSLDATKAFDRVCYTELFKLLISRGTCPLVVRFLLNVYTQQKIRIRWNRDISSEYGISNGVKQGGVLSPILFTVYLDELLIKLKNLDVGCHMGEIFAGSLAYADDVCLLSPSLLGIREMMNVVNNFARELRVQFNPEKSILIVFEEQGVTSRDIPSIQIAGQVISPRQGAKHLGLQIGRNASERNISQSIGDLYARTNHLIALFKHVSWKVKVMLFFTYCVHLYGCESWDLFSTRVNAFHVAFRKCVRRLLCLPYNTHNNLLPLLCNREPVDVIIMNRIVKHFSNLCQSNNSLIRVCAHSVQRASGSGLSNSISTICSKFSCSRDNMINVKLHSQEYLSDETISISLSITELLDCLDDANCYIDGFSKEDVNIFLSCLCTL